MPEGLDDILQIPIKFYFYRRILIIIKIITIILSIESFYFYQIIIIIIADLSGLAIFLTLSKTTREFAGEIDNF